MLAVAVIEMSSLTELHVLSCFNLSIWKPCFLSMKIKSVCIVVNELLTLNHNPEHGVRITRRCLNESRIHGSLVFCMKNGKIQPTRIARFLKAIRLARMEGEVLSL